MKTSNEVLVEFPGTSNQFSLRKKESWFYHFQGTSWANYFPEISKEPIFVHEVVYVKWISTLMHKSFLKALNHSTFDHLTKIRQYLKLLSFCDCWVIKTYFNHFLSWMICYNKSFNFHFILKIKLLHFKNRHLSIITNFVQCSKKIFLGQFAKIPHSRNSRVLYHFPSFSFSEILRLFKHRMFAWIISKIQKRFPHILA